MCYWTRLYVSGAWTLAAAALALTGGVTAQAQTCDRVLGTSGEGLSWANPSTQSGGSEAYTLTSWDPDGAGPAQPWLIVAGNFDRAGDVTANNIAAWDGAFWRALGAGTNGKVRGLGVLNNVLYAAGSFTSAGGAANSGVVAKWDGSTWQPAVPAYNNGSPWPTGSFANGLAATGSDVRVWGRLAGTIDANFYLDQNVYYINNSGRTDSLGCNVGFLSEVMCPPGTIQAIDPIGGTLAICGSNITYPPSGNALGNPDYGPVLGYDWHSVPGGTSFTSTCVRTVNGDHWIGGRNADGNPVLYRTVRNPAYQDQFLGIAPVSPVLPSGGQGSVTCLTQRGNSGSGAAVAIGFPNSGTGAITSLVYEYAAGQNPSIMGNAIFNGRINDLFEFNGTLYAVGRFTQVGLRTCRNIARYDGAEWRPLIAGGVDVYPYALGTFGNDLWAGGAFGTIAGAFIPNLAKLSGGVWQAVTTPGPGQPVTMISYYTPNPTSGIDQYMIVGGEFTNIAQLSASHIAAYHYRAGILDVQAMGSGLNLPPRAAVSINTSIAHNDLIVGGDFTFSGATTLNHVGRWTGAAWQALGSGMNDTVLALSLFGGQIIAGGAFTTANGGSALRVAAWNGSAWIPMGSGFNGAVRTLAVYNGSLYAGGDFTASGSTALPGFAKWSGLAWISPGVGFDGAVYTMRVVDSELLLGGSFINSFPGPLQLNRLGFYNGSTIRRFGQGLDNTVVALASVGPDIYISSLAAPYVFRATPAVTPTVDAYAVSSPCLENVNYFQATATNCDGGQFRWRRNGATLSDGVVTAAGGIAIGTQTSHLMFYPADASDGGNFDCQILCPCGNVISDPIQVAWSNPPHILVQPAAGNFCSGQDQQLAIVADGTSPLHYEWYRNGALVATSASSIVTLPTQSAADNGQYYCRISNACGSVSSQTVQRTAVTPPSFTAQPTPRSACPGGSASFSVSATNVSGASYRWYLNNIPLTDRAPGPSTSGASGAATPSLSLSHLSTADAGYYLCRVTTGCTAISDAALLTISGSSCCRADFNNSGSVSIQDIFDFLTAYFTNQPAADFNSSGSVTLQDIFDFLTAYFTGC